LNSEPKVRIAQLLLLGAAILSVTASLFSGFFYFAFYWPYRGQFNEEGRYFDEKNLVVYHEQADVFIVPMLVFLLLAIVLVAVWWGRRSSATGSA
jgi:uncharacterized membrane protein YdjX (TVP38/TMEM64 family)